MFALIGYKTCVLKFDYSNTEEVVPDSTQMLGYKSPAYYNIGTSFQSQVQSQYTYVCEQSVKVGAVQFPSRALSC